MATQSKTKWALDPAHTEIGFKAKHLMITTVSGKFEKFEGSVETDGENISGAQIAFTADTSSVNTGAAQRDEHLRSADFFDSANFPQMKFVSTSFEKVSGEKYLLKGDLTVRNITKPVQLNVTFEGMAKDPWGNTKAGFILDGKINRKDWNLNWNVALEAGGMLVSEEVKIFGEIQVIKT